MFWLWSMLVAANVSNLPNLPLQTLKQDQCDFDQELVSSIGVHHSHVGQVKNLRSFEILGDILFLDLQPVPHHLSKPFRYMITSHNFMLICNL